VAGGIAAVVEQLTAEGDEAMASLIAERFACETPAAFIALRG
jgi:hypothetical protein